MKFFADLILFKHLRLGFAPYHLPQKEELLEMPGRGRLDFEPMLAALQKIQYLGVKEIFMQFLQEEFQSGRHPHRSPKK